MITLEITPVPKPRMTQRDRWAKRPAVVRYYNFCDTIRELWSQELERDNVLGDSPLTAVPASVHLIFGIEMPKSWSAKKRLAMNGQPHQQKPDIDNLIKAFLDALCTDDSYVYDIRAVKRWSDRPHITVSSL